MELTPQQEQELAELEELDKLEQEFGSSAKQSQAMTALEHGAKGLTAGYLPQLQAGAEQIMFPVMNVLTGQDVPSDSYVEARDLNVARQEAQAKEFPATAMGAQIAGGLAQGAVMPAGALAKGAGALTAAGKGLLSGAAIGALQNPGETTGEVSPLQLKERATGALIGGGIGALTGGAAGLIGKSGAAAANKAADLESAAKEKAFKSFGPFKRQVQEAAARPGGIEEMGEVAMRRGLLKGNPKTYEELADAAAKEKEVAGKALGEMIDQIDDAVKVMGQVPPGSSPLAPTLLTEKVGQYATRAGVDRSSIGSALREELKGAPGVPGTSGRSELFNELISEFEQTGGRLIGLKDSQKLKEAVGKEINWKRLPGQDIPDKEMFYRALYSKLKTGIEDSADAASELLGEKARDQFIRAKKDYGALSMLEKTASNRAMGDFANRVASMSDYQSGQAGAVIGAMADVASGGNPVAGAAKGAAISAVSNQIARRFGPQMQAKTYQGMADFLKKYPNASMDTLESFVQRTIPATTGARSKKNKRLKALED